MTQHPTDPARPDAQPTSLSTRGRRTVAGMEERDALRAEVAVLAARVARLEAALQQVVDEHEMTVGVYEDEYGRRADCVAAARAALAGESDG